MKLIFNMGYHLESFFYMRVGNLLSAEAIKQRRYYSQIMIDSYEGNEGFSQFLNNLATLQYKPHLRKL